VDLKQGVVGRLDRYQVAMCLAALAAGAGIGLAAPAAGHVLEPAINPVLGALLYATFLQVPAGRLLNSLRDGRFIAAALVVNFVAALSVKVELDTP
jgi:ACR3 family arsenite transporter